MVNRMSVSSPGKHFAQSFRIPKYDMPNTFVWYLYNASDLSNTFNLRSSKTICEYFWCFVTASFESFRRSSMNSFLGDHMVHTEFKNRLQSPDNTHQAIC